MWESLIKNKAYLIRLLPLLVMWGFAGCDVAAVQTENVKDAAQESDYERGPHRGRMLKKGPLAVEITIFETGVPPQFRVYPTVDGRPVDPAKVGLTIDLARLGGKIDHFSFKPEGDYLVGDGEVVEPHSFEVRISGTYKEQRYDWTYPSFEGRTIISTQTAREAGIEVGRAGPTTINETLDVFGRVDLRPGAKATLRGRFPGQVAEIYKTVGDNVSVGERLARIDSNIGLKDFYVTSPINGVVLEQRTNVGDISDKNVLFTVGDLTRLHVDFRVFSKDQHRVTPGQIVKIISLNDRLTIKKKIKTILPTTNPETQTLTVRTLLPNPDKKWMPGMTVRGAIIVKEEKIPLGVRTEALQRFRDFTVVFAKVDETYEVRMLELGRKTPEWTEVLGGIAPGQEYVTQNSFLIKADIEKSGASHDH